jgi:hypothetical protein
MDPWLVALWLLLLPGALGLFYAPALDDYFVFEDFVFLERSRIRSAGDLLDLFSAERNRYGLDFQDHAYRPLSTNLYFGLLQLAFGLRPLVFHLANLAVLAFGALAVSWWLVLLGLRRRTAAAMALLFALNAVSFESQLWISVIQELAFTGFALSCFVAYLVWVARAARRFYALSLGLFVLGLLSKETAITLPALLLLYEWIVRRSGLRRGLSAVAPFLGIAALYLAARSLLLGYPGEGPYALAVGGFSLRALAVYGGVGLQALLLVADWRGQLLLGVLLASAFVWLAPERRRLGLFGALWFPVSLAPVLLLPAHLYQSFYLTLPIVGLLLALGVLVDALPRRRFLLVAALLLPTFGWISHQRFLEAAARRERLTGTIRSFVERLGAAHPNVPEHTRFYVALPRRRMEGALLTNRGAVFRVLYDDPSLEGFPLAPKELRTRARHPAQGELILEWTRDGRLVTHRSDPAPAGR